MVNQAELEELGFRWKQRTTLKCKDGTVITVEPAYYLQNRESQGSGERFRKALRIYNVTRQHQQQSSEASELEIEQSLDIDWQARRSAWLSDLRKLCDEIRQWADEEGWPVHEEDKEITEDYIGTYNAPKLYIEMPTGRLHIDPVGTLVIGAEGRVDILAFPGLTRMLLIRLGDNWRLKTDARVDWPQAWGKSAFIDLAKALSSAA